MKMQFFYLLLRYLQENLIKKIEGLDELSELRILNLTDNMLQTIEGLCK